MNFAIAFVSTLIIGLYRSHSSRKAAAIQKMIRLQKTMFFVGMIGAFAQPIGQLMLANGIGHWWYGSAISLASLIVIYGLIFLAD